MFAVPEVQPLAKLKPWLLSPTARCRCCCCRCWQTDAVVKPVLAKFLVEIAGVAEAVMLGSYQLQRCCSYPGSPTDIV